MCRSLLSLLSVTMFDQAHSSVLCMYVLFSGIFQVQRPRGFCKRLVNRLYVCNIPTSLV